MKKLIISIFFLICILVLSLILSSHFYNDSLNKTEKITLKEMEFTASEIAGRVSFILQDNLTSLRWESDRLKQLTDFDDKKADINDFYNKYLAFNKTLLNIWLLDEKGTMTYIFSEEYLKKKLLCIGKNFSYRDYFKEAKKTGKAAISNILNVENIPGITYKTVVLAIPQKTKTGEFNGVLGADINLHKLVGEVNAKSSAQISPRESMKLFCLSVDDGIILSSPKNNNIGQTIKFISPKKFHKFISSLTKTKSKTKASIFDSTEGKILVGAALVKLNGNLTPYVVLVTVPYSEIKSQIFPLYSKLEILTIIIFITVIIVMYTMISRETVIHKQKEKIKNLEIQINKENRKKSVKEIEETEYFKSLLEKADNLRKS